jgi:5'-nucleotidase
VRVLVTNDDGIQAPGIAELAAVAVELGLEVVVAAPAWNSSGASASLTGVSEAGRLLVGDSKVRGLEHVRAFAVEASPAMIVRVGVRGVFGHPPDLVLSGINDGPNTGHAVLHSGTVGAALTAATHGCRAVAFSLGVAARPDYHAARKVAATVIPWALDAPAPLTLNVNVPSGDVDTVRGVRRARLASFGTVDTQVTELHGGQVVVSYREIDPSGEPGSDAALLARGFATVTALLPACEAIGVGLDGLVDDVESATT